jgi:AbrB family looped-hinge helix DNA binding protein
VALVKVKEKYQVTLPAEIMKKAEVAVGDLLEATVEGNKITLAPKAILDRELAQAVKEVKEGKTYGPFNSAKSLVRSLHREVRKLKKKSA